MKKILSGRIWKFDDNISTDVLMPGFTVYGKVPENERMRYCMTAIRPEFPNNVRPGDFVLARENFGCGSVRPASRNLLALGVSAILAESYAGLFYRNCINSGLPAVTCKDVHAAFDDGDLCEVNLFEGEIVNKTKGNGLSFMPFPPEFVKILDAGGLTALLKQEMVAAG